MTTDQARVELAAAPRWSAKLNMHEGVANHFSLAINDSGSRFLMNPNQRHHGVACEHSFVESTGHDDNRFSVIMRLKMTLSFLIVNALCSLV